MSKTATKKAAKKRKPVWTKMMNKRLSKLYPTVQWTELEAAFPNHSRGALVQQACRLGLRRPTKELGKTPKTQSVSSEIEEVSDGQLIHYMSHGRSVKDLAKKFKISIEEATRRLDSGFEGYDLFAGPQNPNGEITYVAIPCSGNKVTQERSWKWQRQPDGQPYGVITFPKEFDHKKIRIIPIDGIHFGSDDHDSERFDAILHKIVHEPNTFCFLNGDIIALLTGGKKKDRERRVIELSVELSEKLQRIAHKILFAQQGCLEARNLRYQGFDPLAHFCTLLDIPYFLEPVYIDIFWGKHLFTLWTIHGHSVAQLKGARMNALRRPAQMHEFTNFLIMGHIGDSIWNRVIKLHRNTAIGELENKGEFHIILGNFTRYLGTMAAIKGATPSSNETIVLFIYPDGDYHVKTTHGGKS